MSKVIHLRTKPGYWSGKIRIFKNPEKRARKISAGRLLRKENLGYINSPETQKKMSEAKKGRPGNNRGKTWKCSLEARKRMSEAKKGDKCHLWRGGVSSINRIIRASFEYRLWREAVFKRDNYTCIWCGARNGNGKTIVLNADHIKPFALYPELRFAIDNGRTLCWDCHKKTDTFGRPNEETIKKILNN